MVWVIFNQLPLEVELLLWRQSKADSLQARA